MNRLVAKMLNKVRLIKKVNTVVQSHINGTAVKVPLINGMGYENLNISEVWMCALLKKIIPLKAGVFIDVGVNVGQTLLKLQSVHPGIEYVGFEPNPQCVYYTNTLIKENAFQNCRLIPVGIFDQDTVLELNLYSDGETDSSASMIENFRPDQRVHNKIFVPVYRFEQLSRLLGLQQIAIVKIDVEGAELEVLQSLQVALRQQRPFIVIEILPCYTHDNASRITRQQKIEQVLKELDYRLMRIIKTKDSNSIEEFRLLDTIGVHSNLDWCDYLVVPAEMIDSIFGSSYQ